MSKRDDPFAFCKSVPFYPELEQARSRIDQQQRLIASFPPGTEHHRFATKVLLLLQDSLHVLVEARAARFYAKLIMRKDISSL